MPLSEEQRLNMIKRREKILDCAIHLFASEGYEATTIKKIAESAEVSFGSVFTYFKDKEQLFLASVVEPLKTFSEQVLDFNASTQEPLVELKEMVSKHIQLFAEVKSYLTLVVQVVGQPHRYPAAFEQLDQFHDQLREKISRLIENGQQKGLLIKQEPMPVATVYTSLLIGIRLNNTDARYSQIWDQYIPPVLQLFGPIRK
ncbi:TetR/AcrR family transcriptional regulator [Lentibacillus sp. N15]|uniref:TetR/AcrR family transcriptional regulator n=1 Tax=Lentibacillus songyuanensis TaxID=3136161 RepID=UPI0031BB0429